MLLNEIFLLPKIAIIRNAIVTIYAILFASKNSFFLFFLAEIQYAFPQYSFWHIELKIDNFNEQKVLIIIHKMDSRQIFGNKCGKLTKSHIQRNCL